MTLESVFQWLGTAGMALGASAFLAASRRTRQADLHHYLVSFVIVLVAATSYLAMSLGDSHVTLADGHSIYYARYIDWAITTPLLLLGLITIGMEAPAVNRTLLYGALAADVYMIATGFIGALATDASRWLWFACSCGGFVAVLAILWGPIRKEARARGRETAYVFLAKVLTGLWFVYPVVWVFGEEGLRTISSTGETAVITLVDLAAKVLFGYLSLRAVEALPAAIEEGGTIVRSERQRREVPASR